MTFRAMNFNPGPAALPLPALERAARELVDFNATGMSVMEQSHRGKEYAAVHDEAISLVRELLAVPKTHEVIFLQGGASQQFAQLPMNFLGAGRSADYILNGVWGEKAIAEARIVSALYGARVRAAVDTAVGEGKARTYVRAPTASEMSVDPQATYLHFTSNETIHGIALPSEAGVPLAFRSLSTEQGRVPWACDMSSDIFSQVIDVSKFAFIYAGAQKNIGPSGVVLGIIEKDFAASGRKDIPTIFQYRSFIENNSLLNTPPTFAIYLVRNVLSWLKEAGGVSAAEARRHEKANLLYAAIDKNAAFYRCPVEVGSRSQMNVVFRLPSEALEEKFLREAKNEKMAGLKGHRSIGGIRVSLYNAVPLEWVRHLVDFMTAFAERESNV